MKARSHAVEEKALLEKSWTSPHCTGEKLILVKPKTVGEQTLV
jgi:hypothetical protein